MIYLFGIIAGIWIFGSTILAGITLMFYMNGQMNDIFEEAKKDLYPTISKETVEWGFAIIIFLWPVYWAYELTARSK